MVKIKFLNKLLMFLEKYIGAFLVLLIGSSYRFKIIGEMPKENVIYSFWHRNQFPLLYSRRNEGVHILISTSKDGDLVANPAKVLGFKPVRGSSSRNSVSALRNMIKAAKTGVLAITPDGPKGPSEKIKDGLLYLAYMTKSPVIHAAVDVRNEWVLNSWDNFRIPKPFTTIQVTYSPKFYIKSKEDIEGKKEELQNFIEKYEKSNKIDRSN